MGKIKSLFSILLLFVTASVVFAQQGNVSGIVKDAGTGEPIPFASVMVKGTMIGVAAGPDGAYKISVPDLQKSILVFSSVGYKDQAIKIEGKTILNVSLKVDNVLQDVVIVAYGTQKKESVTGSVSSVKSKGLSEAPIESVDKMLSGKLAGVNISTNSGRPGAFSKISIRGISSLNAGTNPLWVVDGIPMSVNDNSLLTNTGSSLTAINPSDIESITVLKDAAAASAYGSRAANGVILVTTKSGKAGKSQFDARIKYGVNWLQADSGFRMMNASELLGYFRAATINAGGNPDNPDSENNFYYPKSILSKPAQNWMNVLTRVGKIKEYEIVGKGGNSKSTFYTSLSYQDNKGVFYGVSFEKYLARVNASYKLLNNLKAEVRLSLGYTKSMDVPMQDLYYANPAFAAKTLFPWIPAKVDGDWNVNIPSMSYQNPRRTAKYNYRADESYFSNNIFSLTWTPIRSVTVSSKNSYEARFGVGRLFDNPKSYGNDHVAVVENIQNRLIRLTTSNTATYSNLFGRHSLRVVLGQEAYREQYNILDVYGKKVNVDIPYLSTSDLPQTQISQDISDETMLSYFLITNYNYDNRYFIQANVRRDGSSLFGSKKRWGNFWSFAGSWNVSREKFWNPSIVNLLKVRLSYGVNGNNDITNYRAFGLYRPWTYNGFAGLMPSQPSNPYLSWELNKTLNFGVDFGFFNSRINGSIDVYRRLTDDMLMNKRVPQTSGWNSIFTNIGKLENKGIELQLNADVISNEDLQWSVGFNVSMNRTKVLDLAGVDFIGGNIRTVVGKSLYTYYLYDYYGVDPSTGQALWVSEDPTTKELSLTHNQGKARKVYSGSPEPKLIGGFNTNLSWKGINLSVSFDYKYGNKIWIPDYGNYLLSDGGTTIFNQMAMALKYWKKPGDVGVNPKPIINNTSNSAAPISNRWILDGSYLRIKDVTLSYNIPSNLLKTIHLKGLKVYLSGLNLYCFNGVPYLFDPEMGQRGILSGQYPLTKSLVGGIQLSF